MRVHFAHEPPPEVRDLLAARLPAEVELTFGNSAHATGDVEVLVAGVPRREDIEANPKLRFLIIPFAGLPRPTRDLMVQFPKIAVHNIHHNAVATAETALALLLAAAKSIVPIDRRLRENDWTSRYEGGEERMLSGGTAVILGFGAIGRTIAQMLGGFGMSVIGVSRTSSDDGEPHECAVAENATTPRPSERAVGQTCTVEALPSVLPRADVLFVTVPLTPETEGLVGAPELRLLPDGAILVNVARGPVVNESALFEELSAGRIRAGIDVWYRYPKGDESVSSTPPSAFPFHELDNVVMSPHRAGHCEGIELARADALVTALRAIHSGNSVPNHVDLGRGY